jgi:hypothetical protein
MNICSLSDAFKEIPIPPKSDVEIKIEKNEEYERKKMLEEYDKKYKLQLNKAKKDIHTNLFKLGLKWNDLVSLPHREFSINSYYGIRGTKKVLRCDPTKGEWTFAKIIKVVKESENSEKLIYHFK